ncbi:CbiO1 [Desulforapulum autotrophicum HRM2]|uniref:CbiO1 n=1 Tax=Desulforapulum autotrophicum (strain ATCC 43914 / DSM 3382 / VKM B-1955 / HRM2) TaxID=177437 RepID=C0QES6_DESAH|nr:ABC transporter ATP-binding protein [Desulforapulum autotrophicum]ACN15418.1 CbiO1 [Desulforapulum autotrophicum HRM2]
MEIIKKPVIKLEKISFSYPGSTVRILDALDLEVYARDRIGLIAPNGSGKTTLFHTIMGLCRPDAGTIEIFGRQVSTEHEFQAVRSKIGLLFQDADDQLFCPTVVDDVAFGPLNLGLSPDKARLRAQKILSDLGIADLETAITHRLSGGQKRLVALAAVLAMEPRVLLLDEPTAGLDNQVKATLVKILNSLDIAHVVISHEFNFLTSVTDRVFSMENGKILTDDEVSVHQHEHMHKLGNRPHKHI